MANSFGIFEGGGAKGLAHIGALKAAEERHVKFLGVAGTSAGSIVAALVATGWHADDLYNLEKPIGEKGPFEKNFLDFFDPVDWNRLLEMKKDAERTFMNASPTGVWMKAPLFYKRNRYLLGKLAAGRGIFQATQFSEWLEGLLRQRVEGSGPGGRVLFRDITMPLKIIATDITEQRIQIFGNGNDETPNERVSEAVAASIAIPFFFLPHPFERPPVPGAAEPRKVELVDGGLLSNFPAWVFDEERLKVDPLTPTLGFTLLAKRSDEPAAANTLLGFAKRLFTAALAGDAVLEVRQVANLQIVPLRVRVSTFDFDMNAEVKDDLYRDGLNDARTYFLTHAGPRDREEVNEYLELLTTHMQKKIGKGDIHLRANVLMPIGKDRLKILYTHNMEPDADDQLELSIDGGAAGFCWQHHRYFICDLVDARVSYATKYKMTKYQQALVRRDLKSLVCIPVFDRKKYTDPKNNENNPLIAILSFDSDEELSVEFARDDVRNAAINCSKRLDRFLYP